MDIKKFDKNHNHKVPEEQSKDRMEKARKEYYKMVKGRFEFQDAPGGVLTFAHRVFPEDLLVTYTFRHGEICEIPAGLARHLNNCVKKIRTFQDMGDSNNAKELPRAGRKESFYHRDSRVSFKSLDLF